MQLINEVSILHRSKSKPSMARQNIFPTFTTMPLASDNKIHYLGNGIDEAPPDDIAIVRT